MIVVVTLSLYSNRCCSFNTIFPRQRLVDLKTKFSSWKTVFKRKNKLYLVNKVDVDYFQKP